GRRDRHPTERAAAPLPADPDRDRSRTEYGDCLPGADRPGAATDRHPARQTPGADAARKILTLLTVRADLQTDLYIIAFVGVIIALYVLANFGERHAAPRILTLVAGGILAGLALLVGLLGSLLHLLAFASGTESASTFQQAELTLVPFAAAGALGLIFLFPVARRAVARILPTRPGSPVIYLTVVLGLLLVAQQLGTQVTAQPPLTYGELLAQDIPFLILAFVGVGIFIRRSPRETIERLGLLPPRPKRWWLISIVGIGVFMAVAFGIEALANVVAPTQQKQVTDVTTVLFSHFNNPAA